MDSEGNVGNYIIATYYVVNEEVDYSIIDNKSVTVTRGENYPADNATIEPGSKINVSCEDENGVHFFSYKWSKDKESSYTANATLVYNPKANQEIEITAPMEEGFYYLQYYAVDGSQKSMPGVATPVYVKDEQKPIVTLNGEASVVVSVNGTYDEKGATWTDNIDGNGTITTADNRSDLDLSTPGVYTLVYSYTDKGGNKGTATREVIVKDDTKTSYQLVPPTKLVYNYKEAIDLTGAEIKIIYSNGQVVPVQPTIAMFTNFSTDAVGENKTATFNYNNLKNITFSYTVNKIDLVAPVATPATVTYTATNTLSDISLPSTDWEWVNSDTKLTVAQSAYKAHYVGNDKANYNNGNAEFNVMIAVLPAELQTPTATPATVTYTATNTLSDISLPSTDWEWVNSDTKLTVAQNTYKAHYVGSDKANYTNGVAEFDVSVNVTAGLLTAPTVTDMEYVPGKTLSEVSLTGNWTWAEDANASTTVLTAGQKSFNVVYTGSDKGNYSNETETVSFEVTPAPVTVKANNASKTYGESDPTSFTASVSGLKGTDKEDVLTYTVSRATGEDVNTYVITPSGETVQGNYTITYETGTFTINPKAVTVAADDASKTYGESDPTLTATVTGLVGEDTIDYTVTRAEGEGKGTYAITAAGEAAQGNYTVTYTNGTFTINAKAVTVAADDASKTYGESDPTLTATVTGLVGEDTIDYTVTRAEGEGKGTYEITAAGEAAQGNYTVTYTNGTFTINAKAVTVAADDASKTYGESDPTLTATATGLVGEDTINYTVTRAEGEDKGTYAITAAGEAAQGNYTVTYTNGTFTINAKVQEVKNVVELKETTGQYTGDPVAIEVDKIPTGIKVKEITYYAGTGADKTELTNGADGVVEIGEYTVLVSFESENPNYTVKDTVELVFEVISGELSEDSFKLEKATTVYNGKAQPAKVVSELISDEDLAKVVVHYTANGATTTDVPKDAGTYAITIDVPATANFEEKTGIELGNYVINKKAIDVKLESQTVKYTGSDITESDLELTDENKGYLVDGILTSDAENVTVTVSIKVETGKVNASEDAYEGAITATAELTGTAAENYEVSTIEPADLTIIPATVNASGVKLSAEEANYTGEIIAISVDTETVPDELNASITTYYDADKKEIDAADVVNVGTYTVEISFTAKDTNHTAPSSIEKSFEVKAIDLTAPEADVTELVYSEDMTLAQVPFTTEGWSWGENASTTKVVAGENEFTATYIGKDKDNYTEASRTATVKFTIGKATLKSDDFTVSQETEVYGETTGEGATVTSTKVATSDITAVYYDGSENVPTNAGEYKVTIDVNETTNYNKAEGLEVGTFTIGRATLKSDDFTVDQADEVYGKTTGEGATVTSDKVTANDITAVYYNGSSDVPTDAGEYKVTIDVNETTNYNKAEDLEVGTFVIEKAELDAPEVDEENLTYKKGMTLADVLFKTEGWGWTEVSEAVKAGENIFEATYTGADAENYTDESKTANVTFTVGKASISSDDIKITFNFPEDSHSDTYLFKTYDPSGYTATVTVEGLEEGTDFEIVPTYSVYENGYVPTSEKPTNVGTYRVALTVKGIGNYNGYKSETHFVRIQAKTLELKPTFNFPEDDHNDTYLFKTYDPEGYTVTATIEGLEAGKDFEIVPTYTVYDKNADVPGYVPTSEKPTNVGTYRVAVTVKGAGNYTGYVGSEAHYVRIEPKAFEAGEANVTFNFPADSSDNTYLYKTYDSEGEGYTATATVEGLEEGTDFEVVPTYSVYKAGEGYVPNGENGKEKPKAIGAYRVALVVKGINNYTGVIGAESHYVKIQGPQIYDTDIIIDIPEDLEYDGQVKNEIIKELISINEEKEGEIESITFSSDNLSQDGEVIKAGDYTVTVKAKGTGEYEGSATKTVNFTVAKKAVTVTPNAQSVEYTGKTITTADLNKEEYTVDGVVDGEKLNVSLALADELKAVDAKDYENAIVASVADDEVSANYEITIGANATLTVAKAATTDFTITATQETYTGSAITPVIVIKDAENKEVSETLTGKVSYTVKEEKDLVDAGTYTLLVSTEGANYEAITEKEVTFIIAPKASTGLTVEVTNNNETYTGSEITPTIVIKDGTTTLDATAIGTINYTIEGQEGLTVTNAGTYTLKVTTTGGNYAAITTAEEVEFVVNKDTIDMSDVSFATGEDAKLTYTGKAQEIKLPETISDKVNVTYKVTNESNEEVSAIEVGTYNVTANVTAKDATNYTVSPATITGTFEITPAEVTIVVENQTLQLGIDGTLEELKQGSAYYKLPTLLRDEDTITSVELSLVDGDYTTPADYAEAITATVKAGTGLDNYTINVTKGTLTVTDLTPVDMTGVTFTSKEVTYTEEGTTFGVVYATSIEDVEGLEKVTYTYAGETHDEAIKFTTVGTYEVTANFVVKTGYAPVEAKKATLTIKKATPDVQVPELTATFGQKLADIASQLGDWNFATGTDTTASVGTVAEGAKVTITYTPDDTTNYNSLEKEVQISVSKAEAYTVKDVTFVNNTVTYTGKEQSITITGELPEGIDVEYTNNAGTNADTYNATAKFVFAENDNVLSQNYEKVVVEGSVEENELDTLKAALTINPVKVTVTAEDRTAEYTGNQITVEDLKAIEGNGYTVEGTVNDETLTVNIELAENLNAIDVDEYTNAIVAKVTPNAVSANYDITNVNGKLTVEAATVNMTGVGFDKDAQKTYNGEAQEIKLTGTLPAQIKEVTYKVTNAEGKEVSAINVGTYNITASFTLTDEADGNYEVPTAITGTFKIVPADVTLTVKPQTVLINNGAITSESLAQGESHYELSSELFGEDEFTVALSLVDGKDYTTVGTVEKAITAEVTTGNENGNYNVTVVPGTLTITSIDFTELLDLIEEANLVEEGTYSNTTYEALQEAITVAEAVVAKGNAATQTEIDTALAGLTEAIDALDVDTTALEAIKAEVADLTETDYSTTSWAAITTAMAMDENVQSEIDAKVAAIRAAINGLGVDKATLKATIAEAEGLTSTDYTPASWTTVAEALAAAKVVDENANAVQSAINSANTALRNAIDTLVSKSGIDMSGIDLTGAGTFTFDGTAHTVKLNTTTLPTGVTGVTYTCEGFESSTEGLSFTNAGTYEVTAIFSVSGEYTKPANMTATVVINPKAVTITAKDVTTAVNQEVKDKGYTITDAEGNVLTNTGLSTTLTIEGISGNQTEQKGTIVVGEIIGNDKGNYTVTKVNGKYEIVNSLGLKLDLPADFTADFRNVNTEFKGTAQTITFNENFKPNAIDKITYVIKDANGTPVEEAVNVGTYTVEAIFTLTDEASRIYEVPTVNPVTLVIKPADVQVTIVGNKSTVTYDGSEQSVSDYAVTIPTGSAYSADSIALAEGVTATAKGTNASTTAYRMGLTANSFVNNDTNYNVRFVVTDGSLTINKRAVTLTAVDSSSVYGQPIKTDLTYTTTDEVFKADPVSANVRVIAVNASATSNVGEYLITIELGENVENNYIVKTIDATYEITKAEIVVPEGLFVNKTVEYSGQPQEFTINGNLPEGAASVTYRYNNVEQASWSFTDANMYTVTAIFKGNSNYQDKEVTATMTIEQVSKLEVIANPIQTVKFNQPISYDGLKFRATIIGGAEERKVDLDFKDVELLTGIDKGQLGEQTGIVRYKGVQGEFKTTVINYVTAITATYSGSNLHYGDTVDTNKITVTRYLANGTTDNSKDGVTFENTKVTTDNNTLIVEVKHSDVENSYELPIKVNIATIYVSADGLSKTILNGQTFAQEITITWDTNETASIKYPDGTVQNGIEGKIVVGADDAKRGTYEVTVGSKTATFTMNWDVDSDFATVSNGIVTFTNVGRIELIEVMSFDDFSITRIAIPEDKSDFTYTLEATSGMISVYLLGGTDPYTYGF